MYIFTVFFFRRCPRLAADLGKSVRCVKTHHNEALRIVENILESRET